MRYLKGGKLSWKFLLAIKRPNNKNCTGFGVHYLADMWSHIYPNEGLKVYGTTVIGSMVEHRLKFEKS